MIIRDETPTDIDAIRTVVTAAFQSTPHASGREADIVDALRATGALAISLVAVNGGNVIGHVAYSPVSIAGGHAGWFGLGPVAVMPHSQQQGIGKALIEAGIARLTAIGAHGCVVLGNPAYYGRFKFECDTDLRFPGPPERLFQRLLLRGQVPTGIVEYHPAFY